MTEQERFNLGINYQLAKHYKISDDQDEKFIDNYILAMIEYTKIEQEKVKNNPDNYKIIAAKVASEIQKALKSLSK